MLQMCLFLSKYFVFRPRQTRRSSGVKTWQQKGDWGQQTVSLPPLTFRSSLCQASAVTHPSLSPFSDLLINSSRPDHKPKQFNMLLPPLSSDRNRSKSPTGYTREKHSLYRNDNQSQSGLSLCHGLAFFVRNVAKKMVTNGCHLQVRNTEASRGNSLIYYLLFWVLVKDEDVKQQRLTLMPTVHTPPACRINDTH